MRLAPQTKIPFYHFRAFTILYHMLDVSYPQLVELDTPSAEWPVLRGRERQQNACRVVHPQKVATCH